MFISSVNGGKSMPLIGAYCASKFALEAAADALRMELRPWNIGVVLVEPAQTDTDIWRTAGDMVDETYGSGDRRAARPLHQTHGGHEEDDPGIAEARRPARKSLLSSRRR